MQRSLARLLLGITLSIAGASWSLPVSAAAAPVQGRAAKKAKAKTKPAAKTRKVKGDKPKAKKNDRGFEL